MKVFFLWVIRGDLWLDAIGRAALATAIGMLITAAVYREELTAGVRIAMNLSSEQVLEINDEGYIREVPAVTTKKLVRK